MPKLLQSQTVKNFSSLVGISVNLFLLGYFKYAGFLVSNINSIFEQTYNLGSILLPIGISFFTFQQIAYLCDVTKEGESKYGFREYVLFVTFFPQLIAGPIVHHKEMMPQFQNKAQRHRSQLCYWSDSFHYRIIKKSNLSRQL